MFGGNLDGFTNGIFGGMQAAQRIAATQQQYQQTQYQLDAAKAVQAASDDPSSDAQGDYTPDTTSATYGAPQSAIPASSVSSAAPVADITKAPPLPDPAKPQGAPDPDAVDPLAAGDQLPIVPASAAPSVQAAVSASAAPAATSAVSAAPAPTGSAAPSPDSASAVPGYNTTLSGLVNGKALPAPAPSTFPNVGSGGLQYSTPPDLTKVGQPDPTPTPAPAAPAPATTTAAAPAPVTPPPAKSASLGASILSTLNPISSANADTVTKLPAPTLNPSATGSSSSATLSAAPAGAAAPGSPAPVAASSAPALTSAALAIPAKIGGLPLAPTDTGSAPADGSAASGALASTIARMRQDVTPGPDPTPGTVQPLARQAPGTLPDTRTSDLITSRASFDPRPYAALAQQAPQYADMVDQAAARYNVNPARLALHWNLESSLAPTAPDSATGDVGPLQINRGTYRMLDPTGTRDPRKLPDALDLAAQQIHLDDTRYGQDTPLSVAAYQGGNGSADAIAAGEADRHPNTVAYMQKAFPGQTITADQLQPGHAMSPSGIVQAATQSGPDGVLQFISRSGPPGAPMSDKWRQAESALMTAAAAKGDTQGMVAARDFTFEMMHQGNAANMMNAYQQLSAGNTTGAAQALARANAFFPDGAMGKFGTDAQGNLWGQQVDEHDPTKPMGQAFQITPEKLQQALIQVQDPNQFAAALARQQEANANMRLLSMRSGYYQQLPIVKERIAAAQDATRASIAQAHDQALTAAAQTRLSGVQYGADSHTAAAALRSGGAGSGALPIGANGVKAPAVDAEATKDYGAPDPVTGATMPLPQQAAASQVHADLRMNTPGMTRLSAKALTTGLFNGTNVLRRGANGQFGIFPRGATSGPPLAVVDAPTAAAYQRVMMPSGTGSPGGALGQGAPAGAALGGGRPSGALGYAAAGMTVPPSRSAIPMPAGY